MARCPRDRCSRADDLYARLELPVDASYEAIEIAWRALLKQHHPDVAGPAPTSSRSGSTSPMTGSPIPSCAPRYDRERHPAPVGRGRGSGGRPAGVVPARPVPLVDVRPRRRTGPPARRAGRGDRSPRRSDPASERGRAGPAVAGRDRPDRVHRNDLAVPAEGSSGCAQDPRADDPGGTPQTRPLGSGDPRRRDRVRPGHPARALPR